MASSYKQRGGTKYFNVDYIVKIDVPTRGWEVRSHHIKEMTIEVIHVGSKDKDGY